MALQKSKLTQYGVSANYWRIRSLFIDLKAERATAVLELYLTSETSGSAPLEARSYMFGTEANPFPFTAIAMDAKNAYKIAYDAIKLADPFLADAADV